MELDSCALVLLRSGPRAQDFADDELVSLQEAHLGHLRSLREAGKLVASGPFPTSPTSRYAGCASTPVASRRHMSSPRATHPYARAG
jgi:uncharacterized protein YciI